MKKVASAVFLSLASIAVMAQGTQKPLTVQVDLSFDKQPVAHFDSVVLKDPAGVVRPFAFRTGGVAADVICTKTTSGGTTTTGLLTRTKFVGLSIEFKPVTERDGKIFGHVTVQDTTEAGSHDEKDAAGCASRYVDTTGLKPTSVDVAISADSETIVPIPDRSNGMLSAADARYVLKFKPTQN